MRAKRIPCLLISGVFALPLLAGCGEQSAPANDGELPKVSGASAAAHEAAVKDARIRFNWQMNCQGCHNHDGAGNPARDIPKMAALEKFQRVPEGREFLIRVPGMSRSALSDDDLTELANWMMVEFSTPGTSQDWEPYTVAEVSDLRSRPIVDGIVEHRARLISTIEKAGG